MYRPLLMLQYAAKKSLAKWDRGVYSDDISLVQQ